MTDDDLILIIDAGRGAGMEVGVIHGRAVCRSPLGWTPWNPLDDDGDAFRLAAKLRLNIMQGHFSAAVNDDGAIEEAGLVKNDDERCAAIRRLIVMAAASVGETCMWCG